MTELLTAAQMRAIEAAAIASGEVTGLELMERAGRGVVEAVFEEWPELAKTSHRAVVLCGPGNNGGDGFVVARLLKEWGWEVEVFLYGTPEGMPPDARVNYERWLGMGEVLIVPPSPETWRPPVSIPHVLVDALFGLGLTRPLDPMIHLFWTEFFDMANTYMSEEETFTVCRVAIDLPSGLCSDSGRVLGFAASADLTVTFIAPKIGHTLGEGPFHSGRLRVMPIGMSDEYVSADGFVEALKANDPVVIELAKRKPLSPHLPRSEVVTTTRSVYSGKINHFADSHKYTHGHALILSGPSGHGGAARLSARGALRIGAGLVTVACPPDAVPENAARLDAVMLRAVGDGAGLVEVLGDQRINALCLGPGLGLDARAVGLVVAALGLLPLDIPPPPAPPHEGEGGRLGIGAMPNDQARPLPLVGRGLGRGALRATVLDADALTILSRHPDLFAALHPACILTPHAGEFARLFPDIAAKLNAPATTGPAYSKVDATREAAARAGCIVLFKGPDTVIADPNGRCSINSAHYDRAAPWLATAGSGDVLAGFITGLLARGFAPMQAAETAAWLHVECARSFGPGLIAEDLAEELPKVFRALGL